MSSPWPKKTRAQSEKDKNFDDLIEFNAPVTFALLMSGDSIQIKYFVNACGQSIHGTIELETLEITFQEVCDMIVDNHRDVLNRSLAYKLKVGSTNLSYDEYLEDNAEILEQEIVLEETLEAA